MLLLYCFALCVLHSHSTPVIEYHEWAVEGKTYFGSSSKRLDVCNGGRAWQQDQEARVSTPWIHGRQKVNSKPVLHDTLSPSRLHTLKSRHPQTALLTPSETQVLTDEPGKGHFSWLRTYSSLTPSSLLILFHLGITIHNIHIAYVIFVRACEFLPVRLRVSETAVLV